MTWLKAQWSISLEVRMQLSQRTDESWEVESGKCPTQEVDCVFKPREALVGLKLEWVKQDNSDLVVCAKSRSRKDVARNSDISCWLKMNPGPSNRGVRTAYNRVLDCNAGITLTEASCVRLKRQVWNSLLCIMSLVSASKRFVWPWKVLAFVRFTQKFQRMGSCALAFVC